MREVDAAKPAVNVRLNTAKTDRVAGTKWFVCFINHSIADWTFPAYSPFLPRPPGGCYSGPVKRIRKSFGHAWDGLVHALKREKNLQLFVPVYALVLALGAVVRLLTWEWLALIVAGCVFLAVELVNTAIERLTDVLDDQKKVVGSTKYHASLKATKDVSAAASLVCLTALIVVIVAVFLPYAYIFLS